MRPLISILSFLLILSACKQPNEPEFKTVENVLLKIKIDKPVITADLVFFNHNHLGAKLELTELEVFMNSVKAADIFQKHSVSVPAKSDFKVPVRFEFSPKEIWKDKKGILGTGINLLTEKSIDLKFTGQVKFRIGGVLIKEKIYFNQKVPLKRT